MLGLPHDKSLQQSKHVELGDRQGLHVLCVSMAQGGGAEWITFPVHKVNVSDSRVLKGRQIHDVQVNC